MQQYPYHSAIVLTDSIFLTYGGQTGTSTQAQRNISYWLAEEQMTEHLNSFLLPTIVTGSYFYRGKNPISLDYGNITNVLNVVISSRDWGNSCSINTVTGCYAVRGDGRFGNIDVGYLLNCGGCNGIVTDPYNIQVAFESGFPSGTTYSPSILQALTIAAQINLNEIDISLSNEGTADVGIEFFTNQSYSEKRKKLGNTVFGNSPMVNRIFLLTKKYRRKPSLSFH